MRSKRESSFYSISRHRSRIFFPSAPSRLTQNSKSYASCCARNCIVWAGTHECSPPNKRLKLTARVDYGMNLSSARRSLSAIH